MMAGKKIRFVAAASAAMLVLGVPTASAETNLFDMLFGGRLKKTRLIKPPDRNKKPKRIVRRARISSPKYYTYKADSLVSVKFGDIMTSKQEVALLPTLDIGQFDEAVDALDGFALRADKQVAEALADYYSKNRDFIWVSGHHPNGKATAALAVLGDADNWGLSAKDYVVESPTVGFSLDNMAERMGQLARFEMVLSARVLRYAHDARQGRVDPNRLSGYHDLPRKDVSLTSVLEALSESEDAGEFLTALHPSNAHFAALREELLVLRETEEEGIYIEPGTFIRPGQEHAEFPKVLAAIARDASPEFNEEYGELLAEHEGSDAYTPELVRLIKAAQRRHGVGADGIIGKRTVKALSSDTKSGRLDRVRLAMERLRWLPSDLGKTHVLINQAAYRVTYNSEGREPLSMRTVVGKPSNQTNFFQDEIEKVVFNPYWGVPQSIIVNEMMSRLIRDPGYLDRAGYEVTNARGKRISSAAVNWGAYGSRVPFNIRQRPGPRNALGELKIMFPNKHAIYMHDTPAKNLFARDKRAYSHGCVRLEKPREMAAAVLGTTTDEIARKLKQGHGEQLVPVKIPIYVAYFTALPDETGVVAYHDDVYGRDAHLKKAMTTVDGARRAGG